MAEKKLAERLEEKETARQTRSERELAKLGEGTASEKPAEEKPATTTTNTTKKKKKKKVKEKVGTGTASVDTSALIAGLQAKIDASSDEAFRARMAARIVQLKANTGE